MNCYEVVELIQRYVDFDLTEEEEQSLLSHLKECPECAARFEKLKRLSSQLEDLPKVAPPYSIVDSILPKLKEMELVKPSVHKQRRSMRGWVSWKSILGGMAAGIALVMFLFKHDVAVLQHRAEDLLLPNKHDKAAGTVAAGKHSEKDKQKSGYPQLEKHNSNVTENGGKSGVSDVQTDPAETSKTGEAPSDRGLVKSLPESEESESASNREQRAVGLSNPVKVPSMPDIVGDAQASAPQESERNVPSQSTPKQEPAPTAGYLPGNEKKAVESPARTGSSDSSGFGIRSLLPPPVSVPASEPDQLVSPSGMFTAVIKDQTVVIIDQDRNEVFHSPVYWKDDDTILFTSWADDRKLDYQVKSADGTETFLTIDLETKTETKN